jgi:superfamily II RNA helicase
MEKSPPPKFQLNRLEPLTSQFRLTYNTVLNLTATLTQAKIEIYFQKSFAAYSYRLSSDSLHTELAQIQQQLAGAQHLCEEVGSFQCPLKHHPKRKELERLRKTFKALGPRKQSRVYGREMARKIRTWEKLLSESPKSCSTEKQENCHRQSKSYLSIKQQQQDLQKALDALPEENAFLQEFEYKKNHLRQLGYMRGDELLARGTCASRIYVQELLVTELIYSDVFPQLDDDQLNALLSSVDFEARKNDMFHRSAVFDSELIKEFVEYLQSICGQDAVRYDPRVAVITYAWS